MRKALFKLFITSVISWLSVFSLSAQFVKDPQRFGSRIVSIVNLKDTLIIATQGNGLFVSSDHGKTWQNRWTHRVLYSERFQPKTILVNSIVAFNNRLLAGTDAGIYFSDDNARTWINTPNTNEYLTSNNSSSPFTSNYLKLESDGNSIWALEYYFDVKEATYKKRIIRSENQGQNWGVVQLPKDLELSQFTTTQNKIIAGGKRNQKLWLGKSIDNGKSWQELSINLNATEIASLSAENDNLLVTASKPWLDNLGRRVGYIITLSFTTDNGNNWVQKDVNQVEYKDHSVTTSGNKFFVALRNKIAQSVGENWELDSAGIEAPNALPEGGAVILRDTIWVAYNNFRFGSDQYALPGNLLHRKFSKTATSTLMPPDLLGADPQYRDKVIVYWRPVQLNQSEYRYILERSVNSPADFQPLTQLPASNNSFIDTKATNGATYYYRIRTESNNENQKSDFSTSIKVPKPIVRTRPAYLSYLKDLQMPSPDTLFARSGSEIVRSTDGGKSWKILNICFFYSKRANPTDDKITSISFVTSKTGFAKIEKDPNLPAALIKTKDGGETWTLQSIQPNLNRLAIHFINERLGFGINSGGFGPELYKTTNGGLNFEKVQNVPQLERIQIQNGLVVGYTYTGGNLIFSTDAGETWTNTGKYSASSFVFSQSRWVNVSIRGAGYVVETTNNGGSTYSSAPIPIGSNDKIHQIHFIDEKVGFIIGGYYLYPTQKPAFILRTEDGGISWKHVSTASPILGETKEIASRNDLIYILCEPAKGDGNVNKSFLANRLLSTDKGSSWTFVNNIHNNNDFQTAATAYATPTTGIRITLRYSPTEGYLYNNYYYKTQDGGISWLRQELKDAEPIWQVRFIDQNFGFMAGPNTIYFTQNGGKDWQKRSIKGFSASRPPEQILSPGMPGPHKGFVQMVNPNTIVIRSDDERLYLSTDQGLSWKLLNTPAFLNDSGFYRLNERLRPKFYFISASVGYTTIFTRKDGTMLYKTQDGGNRWTLAGPFNNSSFTSLYFINEKVGFAGLNRTEDGGRSWQPIDLDGSGIYEDYLFLNEQTGYLAGRYLTTDSGKTWTSLDYLSESSKDWISMGSQATLLDEGTIYGKDEVRFVPGTVPCNPMAIEGATLIPAKPDPVTNYSVNLFGRRSDIAYEWELSDGGRLQSQENEASIQWKTPLQDKTYVLSVRATNDYGKSEPVQLNIKPQIIITALDPSTTSESISIRVYPNPAYDKVMVESTGNQQPEIQWYDSIGKVVFCEGNLETGYSVSHLPPGIYFVMIKTEHIREVKRVMVVR